MPEKLERCVADVKADGKSADSAWAICNASLKELEEDPDLPKLDEVDGIEKDSGLPDESKMQSHPTDETVSIPGGLSAVSIGTDKKTKEGEPPLFDETVLDIAGIKEDHLPFLKDEQKGITETVFKQIFDTKLKDCPCKNKHRG